jgi:hypothetical protein
MLLCCGKLPDSEKDAGGRGPLFCARTQGLARGTRSRGRGPTRWLGWCTHRDHTQTYPLLVRSSSRRVSFRARRRRRAIISPVLPRLEVPSARRRCDGNLQLISGR